MPDSMLRDRLTLVKKDGSISKNNIPASVQRNKVYTKDIMLVVERGDHLLRTLPNGMVEDHVVEDAVFRNGGSLSHWEIDIRRSDTPIAPPQTVINNISGHNARVNINSTDNSTNSVIENSEKIFSDLATALVKGIADQNERDRLLQAVHEMRQAQQSDTYKESYQKFISSAAEHITVIAPFLPALSSLL